MSFLMTSSPEHAKNAASQAEISFQRDRLVEAFGAGDAAMLRQVGTDGIVWVPPHSAPQFGINGLVAWLQPFFAAYDYAWRLIPQRISIHGDTAFEVGRSSLGLTNKESKETTQNQSAYALLWRRQDNGEWRIELFVDSAVFSTASQAPGH